MAATGPGRARRSPGAYDIYGSETTGITDALTNIQNATGLQFNMRESDFEGIYYMALGPGEETLMLKKNLDPIDNLPAVTKYARYPVLLYVNETLRSHDLAQMIRRADSTFDLLTNKAPTSSTAPS